MKDETIVKQIKKPQQVQTESSEQTIVKAFAKDGNTCRNVIYRLYLQNKKGTRTDYIKIKAFSGRRERETERERGKRIAEMQSTDYTQKRKGT